MDNAGNLNRDACRIGDRSTSDVVVRLRTPDGRDDWLYCHSSILTSKSKYFADRLSENWPTCQILDARSCVEVYCQESDFDYHVTLLRLLYVVSDSSTIESWHGVRNALGILRVAVELGCPQIVASCVEYIEAMPWEEAEEEEILQTTPSLGSSAEPILSRLQPVDPSAIVRIFLSAVRFATSSPPSSLNDLKSLAQEQLEYMLTEDDDAPLLTACDELKLEVRDCVRKVLSRFTSIVRSLSGDLKEPTMGAEGFHLLQPYLSDLSWACQILSKLEIMRDLVVNWMELSETIVKIVEEAGTTLEMLELRLKVVEVAAKILEAIGYGSVILPPAKRLQMVKVWLPFVRVAKPVYDAALSSSGEEDALTLRIDCEVWQSLESSFVSIILALPSGDQAGILTEWLGNEHIQYPDLTEAFEVWCYRSKVVKKRVAFFAAPHV
ncbi:hypothetical protein Ancab_032307 [Ancistrocladus abbreviatus]